jgi:hypothetical protein
METKEIKEKIKYLKDIREIFIHHIMEIETIGYDFYDFSDTITSEAGTSEAGTSEAGTSESEAGANESEAGTNESEVSTGANELYAIIEIEQQCRNLKILINNFYSNKIEKLSKI